MESALCVFEYWKKICADIDESIQILENELRSNNISLGRKDMKVAAYITETELSITMNELEEKVNNLKEEQNDMVAETEECLENATYISKNITEELERIQNVLVQYGYVPMDTDDKSIEKEAVIGATIPEHDSSIPGDEVWSVRSELNAVERNLEEFNLHDVQITPGIFKRNTNKKYFL